MKVDEWLFWQMGGFGPMLGQNHHFNKYAPEKLPYAMKRYEDETHRLYGVLNKRLADNDFVAGDYSIADMAIYGWATLWEGQGMDIEEFPTCERLAGAARFPRCRRQGHGSGQGSPRTAQPCQ